MKDISQEKREADKRPNKIDVSVVIPAYNEEIAITDEIKSVKEALDSSDYTYEIIVVDDGSIDNTAMLAKQLGSKVISHIKNMGTGAARTTGVKAAQGRYVAMTDADGTYPNNEIPVMLKMLDNYEMVIGARKAEKGTFKILRTPTKWAIRKLACYLTQTYIPDLNSGLRVFKKEAAENFFHILPNSHSWVSTITIAFLTNNLLVGFHQIEYFPRKGKSSFHPLKDTYNYINLVIRSVMYFNPLRVFLPLAISLFLIGTIKAAYDLITIGAFKDSEVIIILTSIVVGTLGLLADLIVVEHKSRI